MIWLQIKIYWEWEQAVQFMEWKINSLGKEEEEIKGLFIHKWHFEREVINSFYVEVDEI